MKKVLGIILAAVVVSMASVCLGEAGGETALSRERALKLANNQNVREIVIPEGIKRIETEAFAGTGLEVVTLPASLTELETGAFDDDVAFIVYHNSYGEEWARSNHRSIIKIIAAGLPDGIDWDYEGEGADRRVVITGYIGTDDVVILPDKIDGVPVYRIGAGAFSGTGIKEIGLPDQLEWIDDEAFSGCDQLTEISFPETVTTIGSHAFQNYSALTTAVIPETVATIGTYAFENCTGLTSVVFPQSPENPQTIFKNCTALKEVTISVDLQETKTVFEGCEHVETIHYLPGTSKTVSAIAGSGSNRLEYVCKHTLTSIDFGEGITTILGGAFLDDRYESPELCSVLERIRLPSTLKIIDDQAFFGQTYLTEVSLPNGLETIGNEAFANCSSLVPPKIPTSVTFVGNGAFYGCKEPEGEPGD